MNYIKRLERDNEEMAEVLNELRLYLHTDKFQGSLNDYVNVKDVLNRIEPIWSLYTQNKG